MLPVCVLSGALLLVAILFAASSRAEFTPLSSAAVERRARRFVSAHWTAAAGADHQAWGFLDISTSGNARTVIEGQDPTAIFPADVILKPPDKLRVEVALAIHDDAVAYMFYTLPLRSGQYQDFIELLRLHRSAGGELAVTQFAPLHPNSAGGSL
ncbi:MAG: hypothetical protein KGJ86_10505 [Chloroflexota bacterium]|nr:hypothetical protein [Chloroflexota bacterium]